MKICSLSFDWSQSLIPGFWDDQDWSSHWQKAIISNLNLPETTICLQRIYWVFCKFQVCVFFNASTDPSWYSWICIWFEKFFEALWFDLKSTVCPSLMLLDLLTVSKQQMILQPNQRSSPRSWKAKKLKRKAVWLCTVSSLKLGFLWNGGRMKRSWCLEKSTRWSRRPQWMSCWSAAWLQKTVETTAVCVESRRPPLVST